MTDQIRSAGQLFIPPTTPRQRADAIACLTRYDATDLAAALGLDTDTPVTSAVHKRTTWHGNPTQLMHGTRIA